MLSMACSALQHTCLLQKVSTKAEKTNPEQYISDMTYDLSKPLRALQRAREFSSQAVGAIKYTSINGRASVNFQQ